MGKLIMAFFLIWLMQWPAFWAVCAVIGLVGIVGFCYLFLEQLGRSDKPVTITFNERAKQ